MLGGFFVTVMAVSIAFFSIDFYRAYLSRKSTKESYFAFTKTGAMHPGMCCMLMSAPALLVCDLLSKPLPERMTDHLYFAVFNSLLFFALLALISILKWRSVRKLSSKPPGDSLRTEPKTA